MAAKRLRDASETDSDDKPEEEKRLRALPSFSTIIRKAVMANQLQNLWREMEPFFRTAVREEVAAVIDALNVTHLINSRSPAPPANQMQIEAGANRPNLQLVFGRSPLLPNTIFTNNRIEDAENNPLRILLLDNTTTTTTTTTTTSSSSYNNNWSNKLLSSSSSSSTTTTTPLRVEVVVLHGDFPAEGHDSWTSTEFDRAIVRARTGRRPLLTGDIHLTLRCQGDVTLINDLTITDNSSWVRSQRFKIGVRIAPGSSYDGPRIMEAMTHSFRVKDHRGESSKKHHPPALTDEVWRLEKIGKIGAYRNRLSAENIYTVQDFLRLLTVDAARLRRIIDMSDRLWESTLAHARTCPIDDKVYTYRKQDWTIFLNSICDVVMIQIDGIPCSPQELSISQKTFVQEMVREAYRNWNLVEEFNGVLWHAALPQNEPGPQGSFEAFAGLFDINDLDQV